MFPTVDPTTSNPRLRLCHHILHAALQDEEQTVLAGSLSFEDIETSEKVMIRNLRVIPQRGNGGDPEVILFWTKSFRAAGNLVVCAQDMDAINRLITAHLVCEIVGGKGSPHMCTRYP